MILQEFVRDSDKLDLFATEKKSLYKLDESEGLLVASPVTEIGSATLT